MGGQGGAGGGTGGGMPDMGAMMAQVEKMQADLADAKESLKDVTVIATVGGGMVTVTATAQGEITAIEIDPEAVDPDDVEMLQDVVVAGVNEALRMAEAESEERLGGVTGGMDLGAMGAGLDGLLG